MKRLLLVTMGTASFLLSSAQVPIDEAHFPNSGLRNYVRLNFDTNGDKLLDDEEVRAVTRIDLSEYRSTITSLKGVEHFIYLQDLELKMVDVDEMDVSANADLVRLKIGGLFTFIIAKTKCAFFQNEMCIFFVFFSRFPSSFLMGF